MRGYAIIKNNNDEVLTDSVSAQKYKNIKIQFKDSEIPVSTVQKKVKGKGEGAKRLKKSIIDKSSGGYGY